MAENMAKGPKRGLHEAETGSGSGSTKILLSDQPQPGPPRAPQSSFEAPNAPAWRPASVNRLASRCRDSSTIGRPVENALAALQIPLRLT